MLLGLACIAADIPAINNLLEHKKNVWLVKAGSKSSLTEGIRQLYHSAPLRNEIAKKGQLYAGSFSIKRMSQAYDALYQQVY